MKYRLNFSKKIYDDKELLGVLSEYGYNLDYDGLYNKYFLDGDDIYIEINTIEDLKILSKKFGSEIIIDFEGMTIEVYNGYRE